MQLLVFTVVGLSAMVATYAFGWGGAVSFLVFLGILVVGICIRAARPIMQHLRP